MKRWSQKQLRSSMEKNVCEISLTRSSVSNFFNKYIFNWRIITFQYHVGFCHTSTWIVHRYTYAPSLLNSLPPLSHPSKLSQSIGLSSLSHRANWLSSFKYGNVHVSLLHSVCPTPSSPHLPVSTSQFSMSTSPLLPWRQVHQYHLSRFHMYVLIFDVYLSLSYFTLCNSL